MTAVLAACFGAAALLLPASTPAAVRALVEYQALVNCVLLVFNLMPAFPLDGGRVLRSLLWRRSGVSRRSTETAASVGRGFGYLLIVPRRASSSSAARRKACGWRVIGLFVVTAAGAQATGAQVQAVLSGVHVARADVRRPW